MLAEMKGKLHQHLKELRLPMIRRCYEEQAKQAEKDSSSYEQYLQAARILQAKLSDAEDPAKAAESEASLAKMLDKLELMKPEIEREEREDQEVAEWRAELRLSFEELAEKIRKSQAECPKLVTDLCNLRGRITRIVNNDLLCCDHHTNRPAK